MRRIYIYLLFFGSGICGLVYQLVWQRKLALIFGNTTYATSAILTAFMGGLALGSFLFGKYVDREKRPLRLYALLEFGIGISALAILFFFLPISNSVYIWIFRTLSQNSIIFNFIRFILSVFILIIPTTLMGGTLPVISKYIIRDSSQFGLRLGNLYATNTVGGMMGAFLTGYYFIRLFGETWTVWIAIVGNLLIAAIAYYISAKKTEQVVAEKTINNKKLKKQKLADHRDLQNPKKIRRYSPTTARLVVWLFAAAGFASLAYEVIWTRALIFYVSSTTYSFAAILTTFLFGIMLGSYLMARWVDRVKNLILLFGIFEGLIAIFALLSIPALNNMDSIQRWMLKFLDVASWNQIVLMLFATSFIILLLPTVLMGAAFPVVNRIYVESVPKLGQGVGSVYMANTIGAVFGSFLSGFLIMPLVGIAGSILFISIINLCIGLVAIFIENYQANRPTYRFAAGIAVVAVFLIVAIGFYTSAPLVTGIVSFKGTRLLYYKDTPSATLSALEKEEEVNLWGRNVRYLNINGHNTAHTTYVDIIIHKMLAHLPMLLHPNPQKALVVGFGFGNTSYSFLQYDGIKRVDCVELLTAEKKTAKFFEPENHNVLSDPRLNYIVNDGRNYILATNRLYDIISINAVDPKYSPMLYTNEFYELCKQRLTSDGYLVAWLPIYGMTPLEVKALIKSFVVAFPHSSLWFNNPEHFLLLGSKQPQTVDLKPVVERLANQKVAASLSEIQLDDPYSILSTYLMGEPGLSKLISGAKLHSDEHPIVEFGKMTTADVSYDIYLDILENKESIWSTCSNTNALGEHEQVQAESFRYEKNMFAMLKGMFLYRATAEQPYADTSGVVEAFKLMKEAVDNVPENKFNLMYFVDWVQHDDLSLAVKYIERAVKLEPKFAKGFVLLGLNMANQGEWDKAIHYYQKAIDINDHYIHAYFNMGFAHAQQENWDQAIQAFERVIQLQPQNVFAHSSLVQVYTMQEKLDEALEHAKISIKLQPYQPNFYFNLGMIHRKRNEIPEAIEAFEAGLELAPQDMRAREVLRELKK